MGDFTNRENWRTATAEFLATYFFVFAGIGSIAAFREIAGVPGSNLILIGIAHGLGIAVGVMAIGRISGGHINPAVTIAALLTGNVSLIRAILYLVAQLGGGVLAMLTLNSLAYEFNNLGLHTLSSSVSAGNGFVLEVVLTFFLVFVVFATGIDKRGNAVLAPFAIGTVVALDHFVAIPLTGASMNPARSFGPALVHGVWDDHWVYWAGPIVGAILAGISYVLIFGTPEDRRRAGAISLTEAELEASQRTRP